MKNFMLTLIFTLPLSVGANDSMVFYDLSSSASNSFSANAEIHDCEVLPVRQCVVTIPMGAIRREIYSYTGRVANYKVINNGRSDEEIRKEILEEKKEFYSLVSKKLNIQILSAKGISLLDAQMNLYKSCVDAYKHEYINNSYMNKITFNVLEGEDLDIENFCHKEAFNRGLKCDTGKAVFCSSKK